MIEMCVFFHFVVCFIVWHYETKQCFLKIKIGFCQHFEETPLDAFTTTHDAHTIFLDPKKCQQSNAENFTGEKSFPAECGRFFNSQKKEHFLIFPKD